MLRPRGACRRLAGRGWGRARARAARCAVGLRTELPPPPPPPRVVARRNA